MTQNKKYLHTHSLLQEKIQYDDSIKVRICITDEGCLIGKCPKKPGGSHNCPASVGFIKQIFPLRSGPLYVYKIPQKQNPKWGLP